MDINLDIKITFCGFGLKEELIMNIAAVLHVLVI